jgi:hypothetical protein
LQLLSDERVNLVQGGGQISIDRKAASKLPTIGLAHYPNLTDGPIIDEFGE